MREDPLGQDECGCCFYSTYLLDCKFFISQKNANFAIVEPDGRKLTNRPSENVIRTILNNILLMENYGYSRMNGRNGRFENRFAPRSSGSTSDIYDRIIHDDAVKEARREGLSTSGSTSDIYDRIIQKEIKNMKW